jgi:hypothetical protein
VQEHEEGGADVDSRPVVMERSTSGGKEKGATGRRRFTARFVDSRPGEKRGALAEWKEKPAR